MVKFKFLIVLLLNLIVFSTTTFSQSFGPGYKFELFQNTASWKLAKAVEDEDVAEIARLLKTGNYNINSREPIYGRTLLLLAVGNDKYVSTKTLLENNADINLRDLSNTSPILEATKFIRFKKHALQILNILMKHKANVNDLGMTLKNGDTINFYTPLMGACTNFDCAKLLLDNKANTYVKFKNSYAVWFNLLSLNLDENIFVAKYIIVDKKMLIPNPIILTEPNKHPLDIYKFLSKKSINGDPNKEKIRAEILDYLHKIDFPKNQVFNK